MSSLAWAFQTDSELLPMFNYYLGKLHQTGVIDRLTPNSIGDHKTDIDASNVQDINGLDYEDLAFPFLALLIGLCVAFMQLGIETAIICKKKCSEDEELSRVDNSTSEEAKEIIEDINNLLLENHCDLGGIQFLTKIRMLSTLPDGHP